MKINNVHYECPFTVMQGNSLYEVRVKNMTPELKNALTVLSSRSTIIPVSVGSIDALGFITYLGSNKFYIHN